MTPKISIIIPAYNAELYIKRSLDSLLHQDFKEIEVIVINDGSTDNTLEIIREYQKSDCRVKIIDKVNEGVSSARNDALDIVQGEWVAFCDADDYYLPESLTMLYNDTLLKEDVDLVLGNAILEGKYKKNRLKYPDFKEKKIVEFRERIPRAEIWGYLFNNEIIQNHKIRFDTSIAYAEDKLFLSKYLLWVDIIVEEPMSVYYYAFNGASVTNYLKIEKKIRDVFYVAKCISEFDYGIKNNGKISLLNRQVEGSILQGMRVFLLNGFSNPFNLYRIYREFFEKKSVFIRLLIKAYLKKMSKYLRVK